MPAAFDTNYTPSVSLLCILS